MLNRCSACGKQNSFQYAYLSCQDIPASLVESLLALQTSSDLPRKVKLNSLSPFSLHSNVHSILSYPLTSLLNHRRYRLFVSTLISRANTTRLLRSYSGPCSLEEAHKHLITIGSTFRSQGTFWRWCVSLSCDRAV